MFHVYMMIKHIIAGATGSPPRSPCLGLWAPACVQQARPTLWYIDSLEFPQRSGWGWTSEIHLCLTFPSWPILLSLLPPRFLLGVVSLHITCMRIPIWASAFQGPNDLRHPQTQFCVVHGQWAILDQDLWRESVSVRCFLGMEAEGKEGKKDKLLTTSLLYSGPGLPVFS